MAEVTQCGITESSMYGTARQFPREERYGLTAQLRRAALSVPINIAEGAGRETRPDYARFLTNALGSLVELECEVGLGADLGYSTADTAAGFTREIVEIRSMLLALRERVAQDS